MGSGQDIRPPIFNTLLLWAWGTYLLSKASTQPLHIMYVAILLGVHFSTFQAPLQATESTAW
jgi:hypothetical protein